MNDRTVDILRILSAADGFVSGGNMCKYLGVSRAAVWKHVQQLRDLGYRIDSAPNRGYRLCGVPDTPTAAGIEAARAGCRLGSRVVPRESTESTNRLATDLAETGAADGTLVLSERQTGGRGRLARSWHSAPGQSLTFSLILRPDIAPLRVPQLSLVTAIAIARAIESAPGIEVQVKWPNDLYVGGRKVAGILCDLRAEMDRLHFLVLGIGINVSVPRDSFPAECTETAASLRDFTEQEINRGQLILRILDELESAFEVWLTGGLAPFREAWRERSLFRGRQVMVDTGHGSPLRGIVRDLRTDGALVLETEDGEHRPLYSGDVSLHRNRP